jgi:hypothetical protein
MKNYGWFIWAGKNDYDDELWLGVGVSRGFGG